ncbi:hypothetical protein HA402_015544 [Bradysia odoriphaga]|nr:hypothetical protein HA402_015544 [Bradysia odoriphaga]
MGKASSFCQFIKSTASDLDRIHILNKDCNIVPDLLKVVKECRKNNCKDPQTARVLLETFYVQKRDCNQFTVESGNLINLLNSALSHLRVNEQFQFQQFDSFASGGTDSLENLFVDSDDDVSDCESESLLLSDIYRERAGCFYDLGDHKMTIVESIRAIRYAKFSKVKPHENLFLLLFCISRSLRHLNQWQGATNVLQLSIKLLRASHLDNAKKSVETMKFVRLLKEIQMCSKAQEGDEMPLNLNSFLKSKIEKFPTVFDSISDTLSNTSKSLQLKWQEDRGRHLVATKTIPSGSTLIIEHPSSWIVHPNHCHSFCQHCCREIKNLVPCDECSSVVFCSVECRKESQTYHPYECDFITMLTTSKILGDMALLCYRTVCTMEFPVLISHIREYHRLTEEAKQGNSTNEQIFRDKFVLGLNESSKLDSSCYNAAFAQTPNTDARVGGDLLKRSFSAVLLTICLRLAGYFENSQEIESESRLTETEELIASVLLRHLQSTSCNAYSINKVRGSDPRRLQVNDIGGATYPIISTTNHSCNSNVYRFSVGKVCIVKALREIQCGEEILDSYGPHFASNLINDRVGLLKGQYLFSCNCSACIEDWSLYAKLPRENPRLKCTNCGNGSCTKKKDKFVCRECGCELDSTKLLKTVTECVGQYQAAKQQLLAANKDSKIDYKQIEETIAEYGTVLERTQKWPCQVLIECQETLKLCWNLQNSF